MNPSAPSPSDPRRPRAPQDAMHSALQRGGGASSDASGASKASLNRQGRGGNPNEARNAWDSLDRAYILAQKKEKAHRWRTLALWAAGCGVVLAFGGGAWWFARHPPQGREAALRSAPSSSQTSTAADGKKAGEATAVPRSPVQESAQSEESAVGSAKTGGLSASSAKRPDASISKVSSAPAPPPSPSADISVQRGAAGASPTPSGEAARQVAIGATGPDRVPSSAAAAAPLSAGAPADAGFLYVLIVDVATHLYADDFPQGMAKDLAGVTNDGDAIEDVFRNIPPHPLFPYPENRRKIVRLSTADNRGIGKPTYDEVTKQLEHIKKAIRREGDAFFFYFSGHGFQDKNASNEFLQYFVLYDTQFKDGAPSEDELPFSRVKEVIKETRDKNAKSCVVLDCCRSDVTPKGAGMQRTLDIMDAGFRGITIFACSKGEVSFSEKFPGVSGDGYRGLFSYYFCDALKGKGDENTDGIVEILEAFRYAKKEVGLLKGKKQEPKLVEEESAMPRFPIAAWNAPVSVPTPFINPVELRAKFEGLPENNILRVRRNPSPFQLRVMVPAKDNPAAPLRPAQSVESAVWNQAPVSRQGENIQIPSEFLIPGGKYTLNAVAFNYEGNRAIAQEQITVERIPLPVLSPLSIDPPTAVANVDLHIRVTLLGPDGQPASRDSAAVDMQDIKVGWKRVPYDRDWRVGEGDYGERFRVEASDVRQPNLQIQYALLDSKSLQPVAAPIDSTVEVLKNFPPEVVGEPRINGQFENAVREGEMLQASLEAADKEGRVISVEYAISIKTQTQPEPSAWAPASLVQQGGTTWRLSLPIGTGTQGPAWLWLRLLDDQGVRSQPKAYAFSIDSLRLRLERVEGKNFIEPEMLLIPAGTYLIGTHPLGDSKNHQDGYELKAREVTLNPYYISVTEVSNEEFRWFLGSDAGRGLADSSRPKGWVAQSPDGLPVTFVRYPEAVAYCTWLSEVSRHRYRVPGEQEWEAACVYAIGDRKKLLTPSLSLIHYQGRTPATEGRASVSSPESVLMPVDPRKNPASKDMAAEYKLFHIFGNVREWCAPLEGALPVSRGGGYDSSPKELNSVYRIVSSPDRLESWQGFRVVRDP